MKHKLYIFLLLSLGMQISCTPRYQQALDQAEQDLAWLQSYDDRETMDPVLRLALTHAELQSQIVLLEHGYSFCAYPVTERKSLQEETLKLLEVLLCGGRLSTELSSKLETIETLTHACMREPVTTRKRYVSLLMDIISSGYLKDKKPLFIRELRFARGDQEI